MFCTFELLSTQSQHGQRGPVRYVLYFMPLVVKRPQISLKGHFTYMPPNTGLVWAHWHFQHSAIHLRGRLQFLKSSDKIFWGSFATCSPSLYEVAAVRDGTAL